MIHMVALVAYEARRDEVLSVLRPAHEVWQLLGHERTHALVLLLVGWAYGTFWVWRIGA